MEWFRFFFGTPRRLVTTLGAIGLIVVMIFPGLLRMGVERLMAELAPLLGPAITLLIVFAGIRMILFGRSGGRKN
jgi:hypothetical protein